MRYGGLEQRPEHALSAFDIVGAAVVLKFATSLALFARADRETIWAEVSSAASGSVLLRTALPGAAYALADVLRGYCLLSMDLSAFSMAYSARTLGLALVWVTALVTPLSHTKWASLGLIALGNFLHRSVTWTRDGAVSSQDTEVYFYLVALSAVGLAGVGSVVCELNGRRHQGSPHFQNAALYAWGLLALCAVGRLVDGASANPLLWFPLGPLGLCCAVVLAAYGVATALFLQHLGSVWKEVAIACQVVLSFAAEVLVFRTQYSILAVAGMSMLFVGMAGFINDGVAMSKPQAQAPSPRRAGSAREAAMNAVFRPREMAS